MPRLIDRAELEAAIERMLAPLRRRLTEPGSGGVQARVSAALLPAFVRCLADERDCGTNQADLLNGAAPALALLAVNALGQSCECCRPENAVAFLSRLSDCTERALFAPDSIADLQREKVATIEGGRA